MCIVVKNAQRGVLVKLAGNIEPEPMTGQLVAHYDNTPQVPFGKFTLKLRQGATSPLVSPPACGTYAAEATLAPWSAPLVPRALASPFAIESGIGGAACPPDGVPPFHPSVAARTINTRA